MKKINSFLLLITLSFLCNFSAINAQWFDVTSNIPDFSWTWNPALDAIDSLTAVIPIADSIYITTDGGMTWTSGYQHIRSDIDISMVTKQKIWTCSSSGIINATSDGGKNWQIQFYDTTLTDFMNYIEMFDSLNGVAMGDCPLRTNEPALFLRTTDGGNNWISMNQNSLLGLYSGDLWRRVDFVDIDNGYFSSSGESSNKLYKTTNGGADWEVVNYPADGCQVLKFYDANFGFAYPSANGIFKTTDGGATWEDVTIPANLHWGQDIEFAPSNPSKIWVATQDGAVFSTDYGNTWEEQIYFSLNFPDLVFTSDDCGWLVIPAKVFRTTNGGTGGIVSVKENISNSMVNTFTLEQNFPNPFNPSTKIQYSVPNTSKVVIKVFDILGNEIETLANEVKQMGTYELTWNAERLPSGVYFYQLKATPGSGQRGDFIQTNKMILLK